MSFLPLLGIRRVRKTLLRRGLVMLLLVAEGCGTAFVSGCAGNGFNGQTPKNYTVAVTAVSGGAQIASMST